MERFECEGILVADNWDASGNVTAMRINTLDEASFRVVNDPKTRKLLNQIVRITGKLNPDPDGGDPWLEIWKIDPIRSVSAVKPVQ